MGLSWLRTGLKGTLPVAGPSAVLAAVALPVAAFGSNALQATMVGILVSVVVVIGLYIFVGNSGIVSFGHVAFMAIGAYTAALLTIPVTQKKLFYADFPKSLDFVLNANLDPPLAAAIAGLVALVFAFLIGVLLLRLTGLPAAFATFSMLVVVNVVLANWNQVTKGATTTLGVPAYATVTNTLVVAIVAIVVAFLFQQSRTGFSLQASREDEHAAAALGIRVFRARWVSFGVSAFVVGVGGAMYAYYIPFAAQEFYLDRTILIVAMLIIGGMYSLWGAVAGALLVGVLSELLRTLESGTTVAGAQVTAPAGTTAVATGLVLLAILLLRPRGITGGNEITWGALTRLWARVRRLTRRLIKRDVNPNDDDGRAQVSPAVEER